MKKRLFGFGVATLAAILSVIGFQMVSANAASQSSCGSGWFCAYTGKSEAGYFAKFHYGSPDLGAFDGGSTRNSANYLQDTIESVYNNSDKYVDVYQNANYGGDCLTVEPHTSFDVTTRDENLVNQISSIKVRGTDEDSADSNCSSSNHSESSSARNGSKDCDPDMVCVWPETKENGQRTKLLEGNVSDLKHFDDYGNQTDNPAYLNNAISSITNNTDNWVNLYDEADYCGQYSVVPPHESISLTSSTTGMNNKVSSIDVDGTHRRGGTKTCDSSDGENDSTDDSSSYGN